MNAKKLKNGMRVHLLPINSTKAVTVLVLTKVGSRYENNKVLGGSHFIEHLMFKGTKRRPTTLDISKTLDQYGAEFNAYTGKDMTGYYIKIASDKAPIAIDLLHDMIFNSKYDQKEITREKGVIVEEIKMYEENPIMHVNDLLEQAIFEGNPLGLEIAGTAESVKAMKRQDLINYRDKYYIPSEMVVIVSGNIPKNVMTLLNKTFGSVKQKEKPSEFDHYHNPVKPIRIKRQFKDLKQIQVALGFETPGRTHADLPAIKLLAGILGGAMSSRLFIEVRERRGLCYSIRASVDNYEEVGVFLIRAGLDAERLTEAMKVIFGELKKIKKNGVTEKELRYMKDNIAGSLKLSLEDSSNYAEFFGRQELYLGKAETPEERLAEIEKVTCADIKRVANLVIDLEKFAIAVVGPYKNDEALLKHLPVVV